MKRIEKSIKGYKAFNKDMTCQDVQYKEGETYEFGKAVICKEGAHFCENPLDVLSYYNLCESVFCIVEAPAGAEIDTHDRDTKIATTKIKIGVRLPLSDFIDAAIDFLKKTAQPAAPGYESQLAASGIYSQLAASGSFSQLAASGDDSKLAASGSNSKLATSGTFSQLALNGKNSVGAAIGNRSKIKGKLGCWITLAEWEGEKPVCVKSAKIDGEVLKEDIWYELKNETFVEVEVENG